jgi:hypothetical protein
MALLTEPELESFLSDRNYVGIILIGRPPTNTPIFHPIDGQQVEVNIADVYILEAFDVLGILGIVLNHIRHQLVLPIGATELNSNRFAVKPVLSDTTRSVSVDVQELDGGGGGS